jgi:hypothetical protein
MVVRELTLAFIIISTLIMAFSGSLGKMLWANHERDCYKANMVLLEEHKQGPLRGC